MILERSGDKMAADTCPFSTERKVLEPNYQMPHQTSGKQVIELPGCYCCCWIFNQRSKLGFQVPVNSQDHIGTGPQHDHL